jgi:signal transduction histidine kinase
LRNLLSNAIKFTDHGSVVLSLRYLQAERAIELKVEDTGSGMPWELKSRILDVFSQANSSYMGGHEGVGLGLYIVKKYTELLMGEVQVESELGKGSTFTITLPATIDPDIAGTVN